LTKGCCKTYRDISEKKRKEGRKEERKKKEKI
jgi:hypothetical protein